MSKQIIDQVNEKRSEFIENPENMPDLDRSTLQLETEDRAVIKHYQPSEAVKNAAIYLFKKEHFEVRRVAKTRSGTSIVLAFHP